MIQDLFLNATIIITFITIENQLLIRKNNVSISSSYTTRVIFGIIAGILGCILMVYSVTVMPRVILDFRNIAIILASIFGGFVSSITASVIIGTFRIMNFGITTSSVIALVVAVVMGIGCPIVISKTLSLSKKWAYATLFCTVIGSIVFTILIKNTALLIKLLYAYWIGTSLVAIVLYMYVNYIIASNELFRKYKEESSKDFLTGLNNVRQFDKIYNNLIDKVSKREEYLSILVIDIDFFKKVNDTYGHAEGDVVLKEVGKILLNTCRDFDIVSRNGGEEFSVMLMDCSFQQAIRIAERIRFAVEAYPFTLTSRKIVNITVSIGVATYPDTTRDLSKLIEEADSGLYKAKQTGRNKVIFKGNDIFKEIVDKL